MLGKSATAMQGCTFMHIIFVSKPKTICYQKQKHDFHYIIIITIELKGSVEKGHQRFLAKIKHCQNCSKSHILVCLGVAKNVLSFFRQNMQKKISFPTGISSSNTKQKNRFVSTKICNALFPPNPSIIRFGFCDVLSSLADNLDLDYSGYYKNLRVQ